MMNNELVSCRVIKSCYDFSSSRGFSIDGLLNNHGLSLEIINDSYSWINNDFFNIVVNFIKEKIGKEETAFFVGVDSVVNNSWKDIENVIKAIGNAQPILEQINRFCSYFFKDKIFTIKRNSSYSTIIVPVNDTTYIKNAVDFIAGSITSIPLLWQGEPLSALKLRDGSIKIDTTDSLSFFDTDKEYKNYSPRLLEEIVNGLEKNKELIESKNRLLKKKNTELEQAYKQLEKNTDKKIQDEKLAMLGKLAAGIAHEINNPLSYVISNTRSLDNYLKTILDKTSTEIPDEITKDVPILVKEIHDGLFRVKKLVEDINYLAHPGYGDKKFVNIKDIIQSSLRISINAYKNEIDIIENYKHQSECFCVPSRISQVFLNIILNSIQAIKSKQNNSEKGKITIETYENKKFLTVNIKDNGVGISEKNIKLIFEPFFTTKSTGEGTGLGLSTAFSIIKSHNGSITCKSEENEKTEVSIQIPKFSTQKKIKTKTLFT